VCACVYILFEQPSKFNYLTEQHFSSDYILFAFNLIAFKIKHFISWETNTMQTLYITTNVAKDKSSRVHNACILTEISVTFSRILNEFIYGDASQSNKGMKIGNQHGRIPDVLNSTSRTESFFLRSGKHYVQAQSMFLVYIALHFWVAI
jgi:hypothetical protein